MQRSHAYHAILVSSRLTRLWAPLKGMYILSRFLAFFIFSDYATTTRIKSMIYYELSVTLNSYERLFSFKGRFVALL